MPSNDPYRLLGVPRGANGDDVRKAYRRLARAHHPDTNPDDPAAEARFKEIQQAYELLSNPKKRRACDDEKRSSRPTPQRKRAGAPRTTAGGRVGETTGSVDPSELIAKRANVSGLRTGGHREVEWQLGGADLARLLKLAYERIQMNAKVSFGNGPGKKPPKPPKIRKPPDV